MKTLKLLFILPDTVFGGGLTMNLNLARLLRDQGHSCTFVVLFNRYEADKLVFGSFPVYRLAANANFLAKTKLLFQLSKIARQFDIVIGGMEFAATNYGAIASFISNKPFVSWTQINFSLHMFTAGKIDRWISKVVYRYIKYVVFPSNGAIEDLRLAIGHQPREANWTCIENFVFPADIEASKYSPMSPAFDKPVVINVGRLTEQKAQERLLLVHAQLLEEGIGHHLVLLGEGPDRQFLQSRIEELNLTSTVFMPGHIKAVSQWLSRATVFALCSRYEGFALVLVEAMQAGVPVVAMNCRSGPSEVLANGQYGVLVPDGDAKSFKDSIKQLLLSAELRSSFVTRGFERANHYAPQTILPKWNSLFDRMMDEQSR